MKRSGGGVRLVDGVEYRVLSVHPVWAWAILFAGKDIENRTWTTRYRGTLLIHASSKRNSTAELERARRFIAKNARMRLSDVPADFPRSQLVGLVELEDCVRRHRSPWAFPRQEHWVLKKPRRLARPIENVKGKLNVWRWQRGED